MIEEILDRIISSLIPSFPPDNMMYCPVCGGTGFGAFWTPCQHCGMTGYVPKTEGVHN